MQGLSAVARETRDEMEVHVGHALAGHAPIVQSHRETRRSQSFLQSPADPHGHGKKTAGLLLGKFGEPLHMGFWHDQGVAGSHRLRIQKGQDPIVLVKEMGEKLALGNAAKRAIHRTNRANLRRPTLRTMPGRTSTRS